MKTISKQDYHEIQTWIYRNARQIELCLWQYLFEDGQKEAVAAALSKYQNEDGGFGNALEADNWNPNSSPNTTLYAINILKMIDFIPTDHPIVQGIFRFLSSGCHFTEEGLLFSIPSNNDYPHAPWWTYNSEANEVEGIGVSAEIAAFVLKYGDAQTELYEKVFRLAKNLPLVKIGGELQKPLRK